MLVCEISCLYGGYEGTFLDAQIGADKADNVPECQSDQTKIAVVRCFYKSRQHIIYISIFDRLHHFLREMIGFLKSSKAAVDLI